MIQGILDKNFPAPDVARVMCEISRNAQATDIFPGTAAIESPRDTSVDRIENLQAQVFGNTNPRLDIPLFNIASENPRVTVPENSQELEGEMVLHMHTSPPTLNINRIAPLSPISDVGSLPAWDAHAGLKVHTVGHLMPRENNNYPFESAMAGNQNASHVIKEPTNASPPQTQTLRVRRSTFVPGWAVPPRVLLVDDDAVTRKLSSKFLQVFGCTTDIAVDGVRTR
jgi:osomolarity two-component system response regulator SKN7